MLRTTAKITVCWLVEMCAKLHDLPLELLLEVLEHFTSVTDLRIAYRASAGMFSFSRDHLRPAFS